MKIVITVFLLFLGLFLYTKLAGPIPFFVQTIETTKNDLFQVTGTAKETAIPDTGEISFGVTKNASTVADAQNQTNTTINTINKGLAQLGIDQKNIKTTNYSVSPNYDFSNGNQTITGYTVTQNIDLRVSPLDKTNQAIDVITKNGANVVGQVSFTFSDQTQKKLEDKARSEAVADAKNKAQSLAGASGIHLGRIINVQENNEAQLPIIRPLIAGGAKVDTGQPTNVTPGENTISISVTLSYETF